MFVWALDSSSENFQKTLEIFRKCSHFFEELLISPKFFVYIIKKNITCPSVDTNFNFWKIKFLSTHGHVISSAIYYMADLVQGEKMHSDWFPERSEYGLLRLIAHEVISPICIFEKILKRKRFGAK